MIYHLRIWLSRLKRKVVYGVMLLLIALAVSAFCILTYLNDSAQKNSQRTFESSLWNALQLQVQSYRFLNYLVQLDKSDFPLNGHAYFEYDLLMSRVDLLREGEIGYLIRSLTGGKAVRLLNIINGELELISLNLSKLEQGDTSNLTDLINRLQHLENQINEFVVLVSQGSNENTTEQRRSFQSHLGQVQTLGIVFLFCLFLLFFLIARELRQAQKVMKKNQTLEKAVAKVHDEKALFLSLITNEMRPSVNAMLGISSGLRTSTTERPPEKLAERLEESGNQLLNTIDMFSDLALIDARKLHLSPVIGSLKEHIESCILSMEAQLNRKDLRVITYIDPSLPNTLCLDFARTKKILHILLQNAITYCPSGSISIQIRPSALSITETELPAHTHEVGMLQIAVRDTGVGLPDNLQQSLRIIPAQFDQDDIEIQHDAGLGLILCHKLIYLMKGEMHFSSAPQRGTEFWVDLPFFIPVASSDTDVTTDPVAPFRVTKHALLVETDEHLAKVLMLLLAPFNIEVTVSEDGHYSGNTYFDLVIISDLSHVDQSSDKTLQLWYENGTPFLFSTIIDIANRPYLEGAYPLPFPLLQDRLREQLMAIWPNKAIL